MSDADIKNRISASLSPAKFGPDEVIVRRCKCDENLINIAIPDSYTIVLKGVDGPLAVRGDGATGGDFDLPFLGNGKNFSLRLRLREEPTRVSRDVTRQLIDKGQDPAKSVTIAVFDTGLEPNLFANSNWQQATTQCATPGSPATTSQRGWNFTADGAENDTQDKSSIQHGSRVAHLIQRQFSDGTIMPKLVPMKVLSGSENTGDLFSLMCAMETARKNNIRVFNMSLGYYGDEDSLLKKYVQRAVNDKVIIVAAAGNQPDTSVGRDFSTMTPKFYPAQFSDRFKQVIAVTTVQRQGTAPQDTLVGCVTQNYGANHVFGVLQQQDCRFIYVPYPGRVGQLIEGSSYATPILAGWLARNLAENPAQVLDQTTLPALLKKTNYGNQLHDNAYLTPKPPLFESGPSVESRSIGR